MIVVDKNNEFIVEHEDYIRINASKLVRKLFDAIFGPSGVEMVEQFENVIHMEMRKNEPSRRPGSQEPRGPEDSDREGN